MKLFIQIIITFLLVISCNKQPESNETVELHNADIIFQTSTSAQSRAIQLATHSRYSHCGIIFSDDDKWYVFEAVQPVKKTPLETWIARGNDQHFVIKRLKDTTPLTTDALKKMKALGARMNGKNYDLYFDWSDERIYCSELVWKLYKEGTGLEVGHLKQLKDFDLSPPVVKQKLKERYGNTIPKNETVIAPDDIFDSDLLFTVTEE